MPKVLQVFWAGIWKADIQRIAFLQSFFLVYTQKNILLYIIVYIHIAVVILISYKQINCYKILLKFYENIDLTIFLS